MRSEDKDEDWPLELIGFYLVYNGEIGLFLIRWLSWEIKSLRVEPDPVLIIQK